MMEKFKTILLAVLLSAVAAFETGTAAPNLAAEEKTVILQSEFCRKEIDDRDGEEKPDGEQEIIIEEKVSYTQLEPGESYFLEGWLINKEKEAVGEYELARAFCSFTPEESGGTVILEYRVDASELPAEGVVAKISLNRLDVCYPEEQPEGECGLGPASTRELVAEEEIIVPDL